MIWVRILFLLMLALAVMILASQSGRTEADASQGRPVVMQLRVENEAITPVTARFVKRSIERAEEQRAAALIIMLDTPGGLVDSTRQIVSSILHSKVPVVVYVSPTGARAASAGVFITMAGHVAAMAPGTTIGAAHPVQLGGLPGSPPPQPAERQTDGKKDDQTPTRSTTPIEDKIVNDTVAWARTLAELRGRNAEWAARAVKESISVPASEAMQEKVIDFIAEDINDLLAKIEGREVSLIHGKVTLHVAGADLRPFEMWWGERMLAVLANPTLAFLLLMFGFYGILFELYTPGWGVPGTVGVICLVLGFFALAVLPISYVALALIVIALVLFVAEAFVVSYGALTLGGIVCLVVGGLMLVDSPPGFMRIPLWTLVPVALATAAITFFLVASILKSRRVPAQTGSEAISGTNAVADEEFHKEEEFYRGMVRMHGELWSATSTTPIAAEQTLGIESRDGLTLRVKSIGQTAPVLPIDKKQHRKIA